MVESEWLVREPDGKLDIRYILYDHGVPEQRLEELLVWASRDLKLKAVRLILIVAKRAGKHVNIDRCVFVKDLQIFINERVNVEGEIPALFACVTNIGITHDQRCLLSLFKCLLDAKGNPYQRVSISDDGDFEVRTCVREYLENILEESRAARLNEIERETETILQAVDLEDSRFMLRLDDGNDNHDIFDTKHEIEFAEDVKRYKDEEVHLTPEKKRRESVFGRVKRKMWTGLSRKPK